MNPSATYNWNYATTWAERTALVRVFDDGAETYLEFSRAPGAELRVSDADGKPLRAEQYGAYVVVPGVHRAIVVQAGANYSHIAARSASGATASAQAKPLQVRIGQMQERLRDLMNEVAAEQGNSARGRELVSRIEALEEEVDGIAATVLRVRFASRTTSPRLSKGVSRALVGAAKDADRIIIRGYTDGLGTKAGNVAVARARASSVRRLLVKQGVGAQKIQTSWSTHDDYIASNETDEGRARNRRVEVVLLDTAGQRLRVAGTSDYHLHPR